MRIPAESPLRPAGATYSARWYRAACGTAGAGGGRVVSAPVTTPAPPPSDEPDAPCPGCGATLSIEVTVGKRYYSCPSCGGVCAGIAIFREIVGQQVGHQLWAEALQVEDGSGTGPCPFCQAAMKPAPVENGRVWACKTCEMAWLDRPALVAMTTGSGPRLEVGTEESVPRCENCGAPLLHSWDKHCTYCLAPIVQRTKFEVKGVDNP